MAGYEPDSMQYCVAFLTQGDIFFIISSFIYFFVWGHNIFGDVHGSSFNENTGILSI